ncbi:hypothetical protein EMPG_16489, partial [Blastomyces silverae]
MALPTDINSMADVTATVITTAAEAAMPSTSLAPSSALFLNLSAVNSTLSKLPFLSSTSQDLLLYPLRVIYQAEVFIFITAPRSVLHFLGLEGAVASMIEGAAGALGGGA